MKFRRARPTLRLLESDLNDSGRFTDLVEQLRHHPSSSRALSDIDHPIIKKSVEWFGDNPEDDRILQPITSATHYTLYEIKSSQWRGGVWKDADGVNWILCAGLAKGEHKDHDDFYQQVSAAHTSVDAAVKLQPQPADNAVLKAEKAATALHMWKLELQQRTHTALTNAIAAPDGDTTFDIEVPGQFHDKLPQHDHTVATVSIWHQAHDDTAEIEVSFSPNPRWASSNLLQEGKIQVLNSILPPLYRWDVIDAHTFYGLEEAGFWAQQADDLKHTISEGVLLPSVADPHSHYVHRGDIAHSTVEGTALRALCGSFFVSTRNPDQLVPCPECEVVFAQLER